MKKLNAVLFPEWAIVMDSNENQISSSDDSSDDEESGVNTEIDQASEKKVEHLNTETTNLSAEEISKYVGNQIKMDKLYERFQEKIKCEPDQVIRYQRFGEPLWISSKKLPEANDIPNCEYCGSPRKFEFQVMPQMLIHLDLDELIQDSGAAADGIDWGVLCIFTCSSSCKDGKAYKQEFLWMQDVEEK